MCANALDCSFNIQRAVAARIDANKYDWRSINTRKNTQKAVTCANGNKQLTVSELCSEPAKYKRRDDNVLTSQSSAPKKIGCLPNLTNQDPTTYRPTINLKEDVQEFFVVDINICKDLNTSICLISGCLAYTLVGDP